MTQEFTGVWLPSDILSIPDLGITEKLILAQIKALDNDEGCNATNEYFATLFGLSKERVRHIIASLCSKGWLKMTTLTNNIRWLKIAAPPAKNSRPPGQKQPTPPAKNSRPYYKVENKYESKEKANRKQRAINEKIADAAEELVGKVEGKIEQIEFELNTEKKRATGNDVRDEFYKQAISAKFNCQKEYSFPGGRLDVVVFGKGGKPVVAVECKNYAKQKRPKNATQQMEKYFSHFKNLIWVGQMADVAPAIEDLKKYRETGERGKYFVKELKSESAIIYPFPDNVEFLTTWYEWLKFRRLQRWSTIHSYQQNALVNLDNLSSHNPQIAIEIIKQSLLQGWQGLFPLKTQKSNQYAQGYSQEKLTESLNRRFPNG